MNFFELSLSQIQYWGFSTLLSQPYLVVSHCNYHGILHSQHHLISFDDSIDIMGSFIPENFPSSSNIYCNWLKQNHNSIPLCCKHLHQTHPTYFARYYSWLTWFQEHERIIISVFGHDYVKSYLKALDAYREQ